MATDRKAAEGESSVRVIVEVEAVTVAAVEVTSAVTITRVASGETLVIKLALPRGG